MELKPYQLQLVETAVEILDETRLKLRGAQGDGARRQIAAHDGAILLEAPTGSGKTLVAGHIAAQLCARDKTLWFWFAPFAGLIEQSRATLARHFPELAPRDLLLDRQIQNLRNGDVFVSTWASVVSSQKEARRVRVKSESQTALDVLLEQLRAEGFLIGAVVDEAHHSFSGEQTAKFFRETLRPDFTLLVTATPGDSEIESFRRAVGLSRVQRLSVSRAEAVENGLIKRGIKCAAYFAPSHLSDLADYETLALRDGLEVHRQIKASLESEGIALTPLLLVQIASTGDDEARVKAKLLELGVTESAIAIHTAKEPDPDVLAVALDESKEVLIFKMAVALGFDAPRAWTLVSMRGARDPDFGIQIVGRIGRVHPKLQGQKLPDGLNYGYVILADAGAQSGLLDAGKRINALQTSIQKAAPLSLLVRVGNENRVELVRDGQPSLEVFWNDAPASPPQLPASLFESGDETPADQLSFAGLMTGLSAAVKPKVESLELQKIIEWSRKKWVYPRRADVPARFQSQLLPLEGAPLCDLHATVARKLALDAKVLADARRLSIDITKNTSEIFGQLPGELQSVKGKLSFSHVENRARQLVLKLQYLDEREIYNALLARLRHEFEVLGQTDISDDEDALERALALVLVLNKYLLPDAMRAALREKSRLVPSAEIPSELQSDENLTPSLRNIYGVVPPKLNRWETHFVQNCLDNDGHNIVKWWHRNPPLQSHSLRVYLENGEGFYPDFVVGVQGRGTQDEILLLDTKGQINEDKAVLEAASEHPSYGRVMLTFWENETRWRIVERDAHSGRSFPGRDFDTRILPHF